MPQSGGRKRRKSRKKGRGQSGDGVWDDVKKFAGKANDFLKKTKIVSTVGKALKDVPYVGGVAGTIGSVAEKVGYGKRPSMKGRGSGVLF